jgi:hypothetical protein
MKQIIPFVIAIATGLLTLIGLLADVAAVTLILEGAAFLAALALLLGIVNLFTVHAHRLLIRRNIYSLFLLVSMAVVLFLGFTDGNQEISLAEAFNWVQRPLEAALASLLAFFLVGAILRMARQRGNRWTSLFLFTVIFILLTTALASLNFIPESISTTATQVRQLIDTLFVTAGIRGLLIGVALGTIMISLRLLVGLERPYNK